MSKMEQKIGYVNLKTEAVVSICFSLQLPLFYFDKHGLNPRNPINS